MSGPTPMKNARLASLALSWAFTVVACGAALNAFAKYNMETKKLLRAVPANVHVAIDASGLREAGIIVCMICLLTVVLTSLYILLLIVPLTPPSSTTPLATRSLRFQWISLAFCWMFLFATHIAFTIFAATGSAHVTASIGNLQLPPAVIDSLAKSLGVTTVYRRISYLRLAAIFPWFTLATLPIPITITLKATSCTETYTQDEEQGRGAVSSLGERPSVLTDDKEKQEKP